MLNITPHKKLEIYRQAENNPGAAMLAMLDLLHGEIKKLIDDKFSVIDKEIIAKSAIEAVNYLKGVKGKDGFTPVKGQHYFTKTEQKEFLKLATPRKGVDYLTEREILAVRDFVVSKIHFPQDGRTPTQNELTDLIKPLIPQVKDGKTPSREYLSLLIRSLLPKIKSEITGEDIMQKINSLPFDLKFQIPASRIIGLPKIKKGRYLHGGGDTVAAGTNISISRNTSTGITTISSSTTGEDSATETLTGTQSGNNVTLNLLGLANTFVTIMFVSRQGQILNSSATDGWSRSGNTITITNASASDTFQVTYTYT